MRTHRVVSVSVPLCLAALLSPGPASRAIASDPDFTVPKGRLTFDVEGTEGGPDHVTIGRGYDMKEDVVLDLIKAGVSEELAKKYAQGALAQTPEEIAMFVKDNSDLPEITAEQQK
jgi:hypothetical protein